MERFFFFLLMCLCGTVYYRIMTARRMKKGDETPFRKLLRAATSIFLVTLSMSLFDLVDRMTISHDEYLQMLGMKE